MKQDEIEDEDDYSDDAEEKEQSLRKSSVKIASIEDDYSEDA